MPMPKTRVIVGLSGGVDSSVAALRLIEQGYEVHGVFMKNWEDAEETGYCSVAEDLADARAVCETLSIPFHQVNFAAAYRDRVFAHFLAEYHAGRTPNPDVLCNTEIKFKAFLDHARRLGADHIATGHYVQCDVHNGQYRLLKGVDPGKDQSYFLHGLTQAQLSHALFPIGDWHKSQVRAVAAAAGLVTHDKRDSTGICFIGERKFREFLSHYLPAQPGPIETPEGTVVGQHAGLMFHTIGQRQGLGIGGRHDSSGAPWYVADKRMTDNTLIVVQGTDHPALFHRRLRATSVHWISGTAPATPFTCHAKIRYRQHDQACTVVLQDGDVTVCFNEPQRAIAPGQSVVFYREDVCLGGGIITIAEDDVCR